MKEFKVQNIDEYIAQFSDDVHYKLKAMRQTIKEAAPEAQEKISYQMPTFTLHGNLVHFAAHKNHIGFYPTPSGIEAFKSQLSPYQSSKGAVQFPLDQLLPLDLVSQIVKFRVQENVEKPEGKSEKNK